MQLLPNTWEKGITTSLSLIITQIKVEACYAGPFFFFVKLWYKYQEKSYNSLDHIFH